MLHHQRPAGLRLISIAEAHANIDILDGTSQRAGNQLESKIDARKLPLQFVDARHQPMRGESRGDRERDGLAAMAPPLDLDQPALDATEAVDDPPIEQFAFLCQNGAARGPVKQPDS